MAPFCTAFSRFIFRRTRCAVISFLRLEHQRHFAAAIPDGDARGFRV